MGNTFTKESIPSAWPFSYFPLPSPSYAFPFWSIILALHDYSHPNFKDFYTSRAKPPTIDFLIQTGQVTLEKILANFLPSGIKAIDGLQHIFEIYQEEKSPGEQRCKVYHVPWSSSQVFQRGKLGEKCPFWLWLCWQQHSNSHPRGLAMAILIPGRVHRDGLVDVKFGDSRERKKTATLYNSSL